MRWIVYTLMLACIAHPAYFILTPEKTVSMNSDNNAGSGDTLVLVKERESGELPTRQQPLRITDGKKLCYALGPYTDDISARVAQARSLELGLTGLINQLQVPNLKDAEYWVHIPPLESRQAAMEKLGELQRRSVDSYIITQGDLVDGISLGLFRKESSATNLTNKLKGMGFANVAIKEIGATDTEYWIEVREITKLDDVTRRRIRAEDADVQWQMVACKHQGSH